MMFDDDDDKREAQESAYCMFLDLLYDCEAGDEKEVTLEEILFFFSGAHIIPPNGFETAPSISFNGTAVFPMASTCSLQLTLPTQYKNDPSAFRSRVIYGIKNHGGYGTT